jgi:hypothetical protein
MLVGAFLYFVLSYSSVRQERDTAAVLSSHAEALRSHAEAPAYADSPISADEPMAP